MRAVSSDAGVRARRPCRRAYRRHPTQQDGHDDDDRRHAPIQRERFAARLAQARGNAERGDAAGARTILEDVTAQGGRQCCRGKCGNGWRMER